MSQNDARRGRGQYCSHPCAGKALRPTTLNRTCELCGAAFHKNASTVAHGGGRFCSLSCAVRSRSTEPLWSRVWRRIDYGGPGCWPWTAGVDRAGYGVISYESTGKRRPHQVTRVVWFLIHGEWPITACHRCDNPICCRPSHLFNGTRSDNIRDMWAKGRGYAPGRWVRGEQVTGAKLTADDVRAIRRRRAAGENMSVLARAYGVSPQAVRALCVGKTWKHVV